MEAGVRQVLCYLQLKVLMMASPVPTRATGVQLLAWRALSNDTIEVLCGQEDSLFHRAVEEPESSWLFVLLRSGGREGGRQGQGYFSSKDYEARDSQIYSKSS